MNSSALSVWSLRLGLLGVIFLSSAASRGATFTVSSTADTNAAGTLRGAVASANAATGSTINFMLPPSSTIKLTGGTLYITASTTITGPGAGTLTIDGDNGVGNTDGGTGGAPGVFVLSSPAALTMSGLTITNGHNSEGGALFVPAGATATLTDLTFTANKADLRGGAIASRGTLHMLRVNVTSNTSIASAGGIYTEGSADCTDCAIMSNSAPGNGGWLGSGTAGSVNLLRTTFSANKDTTTTGAFECDSCTTTINDSTFAADTGAQYDELLINHGTATILNTTFTGASGVAVQVINATGSTVANSIFNSAATDCGGDGTLASMGGNLSHDNSCALFFTQTSDALKTDPQLKPLGNYGGQTMTQPPNACSPAINTGVNAKVVGATDQLQAARIVSGVVDKGSVEYASAQAPCFAAGSGPNDQTVFATQPFSFSVTPTTQPGTDTYQWQFNDVNIPGATPSSVGKMAAALSDAGNYRVIVTNTLIVGAVTTTSTTTSREAKLTVIPPPAITTQPQGETVFAGQPISLTVVASGQSLTYQWFLNGAPVAGATSATYAVASATDADAGSYTVTVTNPAGSVTSNPAAVIVKDAPVIGGINGPGTSGPNDVAVFVGQPVTLTVTATGDTLSYQWFHGGAAISGASSATYSVAAAAMSDAGTYYVVVSNPAGSTQSRTATVTINGPPVITQQPQTQTVFVGQTLTLKVVAAGAQLSYQWSKESTAIVGATSATYTKANVTAADAGNYQVVVSNPAGRVTSNTAVITVAGGPIITTQPADQTLFVGQTITLSVGATGTGLMYQWQQNGTDIFGANSSEYTKTDAQVADSGSYAVIVSNAAATVTSHAAQVTVYPAPTITQQPAGATVPVGDAFTVTVVATGQQLSYQWSKHGVQISGAMQSTYTINHVAFADAGSYQVAVSNPAGSVVSEPAVLTVVTCVSDSDCGGPGSASLCESNVCVSGCSTNQGRNSCGTGYTCDPSQGDGVCRPDYLASGGCTSPGSLNALAVLAAAVFFFRKRKLQMKSLVPVRVTALASAAFLGLMAMFAAKSAQAQQTGFAADRFTPAPAGGDWFGIDSIDIRGDFRPAAFLIVDYAHAPVTVRSGLDSHIKSYLLRNQTAIHGGFAMTFANRFRIGLTVPLISFQNGEAGAVPGASYAAPDKVGYGDFAISADVRLFGGEKFRGALGVNVQLPTGSRAAYTTDGTVRVSPRISVAGDERLIAWAFNARLETNRDENIPQQDITTRIGFGAAVGLRLMDQRLLIGPELNGSAPLFRGAEFRESLDSPLEGLLGAHMKITDAWTASAGLGTTFSSGVGSPPVRVLVGLQWAPGVPAPPLPPPPAPMVVEAPPPPAPVVVEPPPPAPAPTPIIRDTRPRTIFDRDAMSTDDINFENDSARLLPSSENELHRVLALMQMHPEVTLLEVAGYASYPGTREYNQKLSEERAHAVRQWLIKHGIYEPRLVAKGYGETHPKAIEDTMEGEAVNRRVEFHPLKADGVKLLPEPKKPLIEVPGSPSHETPKDRNK